MPKLTKLSLSELEVESFTTSGERICGGSPKRTEVGCITKNGFCASQLTCPDNMGGNCGGKKDKDEPDGSN